MPEELPEYALEIQGLRHLYGDTPALVGVDLVVEAGAFTSVLGPSGCGKTTLLRCVAGLVEPTDGRLVIGGVEVVRDGRERVPVERRRVGLVFQDYALFPALTVRENVAFGVPGARERVASLIELVGLGELADRYPAALSGGQQQRVALARALAPRPALLLLDEPFANVDAELKHALGAELRGILEREGAAALMVTHDRDAALALSDRVVVLSPGESGAQVAQEGTPEAIYRRSVSLEVAQLAGPVRALEGLAAGEVVGTPVCEGRLMVPQEGLVTLLVRPEQVRATPDPAGLARVVDRRFIGRGWRLVLRYDRGELLADCVAQEIPEIGALCRVELIAPVWVLSD